MTLPLWLLVRTEVLRLARTAEVVRYIVLPALLGPPVLLFMVVLATSMRGSRAVVALPPDLPAAIDVQGELEDTRIAVHVEADPLQAWADGRAEGAVVGWHEDGGVGGATSQQTEARWVVEVVADHRWLADALRGELRWAGDQWMTDMVALAGGDPEQDLEVARLIVVEDPPETGGISGARALMAYTSFLLGLVAYLFVALPLVADRAEGVIESFRALPVPPYAVVLSRVVAMGVLQLLVLLLLLLNVMLMLGPLARGQHFPVPSALQLATVGVCTAFVSSGYALVGVHAHSVKVAGNSGTLVMFAHIGLLGWALGGQPPAWVPIAGAIAASGTLEMGIGVAASFAATALVVGFIGRQLSRRVDLIMPRGGA